MRVFCVFSIVIVLITFGAAGGDDTGAPITFESTGDTMLAYIGTGSFSFSLSDLDEYDTTNVKGTSPLVIIAPNDTFVVTPQDEPFDFILKSPMREIYETVNFPMTKRNILRSHEEFGTTVPPDMPSFEYTSSADEELRSLRQEFNLDSIAGNGTDLEQVMNLLEWAHTIVRHDGSSKNPSPRDAHNIIRVCMEEDRGVNCRMMATVLNEAYLAMGFKSRHVTCLPMDKEDPDCHVTNMIYVPSLNKWIYVDPTFGGYFKDENGTLLDFAEIRERLIAGDSLVLPETMDWNGKPKHREDYLNYMTKNMFRFSVPLVSAPGYETDSDLSVRAWVHLNPVGYDDDLCGTADSSENKSGTTYINYYTDDADLFWSKPD
jgi:hypothetical protein